MKPEPDAWSSLMKPRQFSPILLIKGQKITLPGVLAKAYLGFMVAFEVFSPAQRNETRHKDF